MAQAHQYRRYSATSNTLAVASLRQFPLHSPFQTAAMYDLSFIACQTVRPAASWDKRKLMDLAGWPLPLLK